MSKTIQQPTDKERRDKYDLRSDEFIVALVRSVLIFMGVLLVLIVVGMLALDGKFDIMGIAVWIVSLPLAILNALFVWLLYRIKIDRKPLVSVRYCLLECLLVFVVFILCAWGQDYLANIMWYEPVEVRFWYSEQAVVLITVLIVLAFYLIKKWVTTRYKGS